MPNVKKIMESEYITIDLIKESPTKRGVIIEAGELVKEEDKIKLIVLVDIDKQRKKYCPNKTSMRKISKVYGEQSEDWVGMIFDFSIETLKGKEAIICNPSTQGIVEKKSREMFLNEETNK